MRRNAFGFTAARFGGSCAASRPRPSGSQNEMTSAPARLTDDCRKRRRDLLFTMRFMLAPYAFFGAAFAGVRLDNVADAALMASRTR